MNRSYILFLYIFFFLPCLAEQEREVWVKSVRGEFAAIASMDISMRTARDMAREDAKKQAISKVCGEKLNAWNQVESSSAGESFNSLTILQVDGEVVEFNIVDEGQIQNPLREQEMLFYCVANIKVKKGIEPDPDFKAEVDQLRGSYISGEALTFSITPYRDCYLKVFLFENTEIGYRLYPNNYDYVERLIAGQKRTFPQSQRYEITLSTSQSIETNHLVFVFTKDENPYYNETTSRQEIEQWMARIPNDRKYIYYTTINIINK